MAAERALTLTEAAHRLHVTPQRISQMLRHGHLAGPGGRAGRAQKHAPRVWESSLEEEIARREKAQYHASHQPPTSAEAKAGKPAGAADQPGPSAREAAALEAALLMKLKLDEARKALREERQANKRLTSMLAAAIAELQAAHIQADRLDKVTDSYSEALTQLLLQDPSVGLSCHAGCLKVSCGQRSDQRERLRPPRATEESPAEMRLHRPFPCSHRTPHRIPFHRGSSSVESTAAQLPLPHPSP
jgi:hypothetical protein